MDINSPLLLRMGVRDRAMLERLLFKAPVLMALALEPITRARMDAAGAQTARAARVGRDRGVVDLADYGHSVRLNAALSHCGVLLREADVTVAEEVESPGGRKRVRRARRADPLDTLVKHGSIRKRHYEAACRLRTDVEGAAPRIPSGAMQSEVRAAFGSRLGVSMTQMKHADAMRAAMEAVSRRHRAVVGWLVGGGTISGFCAFAHVHNQTAAHGLKAGLGELADYYFGPEKGRAP